MINDSEISNIQRKISILKPFLTSERWDKIQKVVKNRTYDIAPVLEHIYDNGNVSAVMRSAESYGFINFHIFERPDGHFKHSQRVSQGTEKWLKIKKNKDHIQGLKDLKKNGFKLYATHLDSNIKIEEIDFTQPTAIIFGNEKDGVTNEALDLCDGKFIIPMNGFAQSFNISVAAAICFYHIYNFRLQKLENSGNLSSIEKDELILSYMLKSIDGADKILKRYSE